MSVRPMRAAAIGLVLASMLPAIAQAAPLTPVGVFLHAAPIAKLIMIGLLGSTLAAVAVCAAKLLAGPRLSGGSAFLSGLRIGGPLTGLLGVAYNGLAISLGIANLPFTPTPQVIAPGLAEMSLLFGLGLLAGSVAVIAHWLIEAHIDRVVLKA